jgi:cell division protein FtsW (lipid II flippase)
MTMLRLRSWVQLVLCYWLIMSVVFFIELRYMERGWAGLPGFLLTLPLSTFVVAVYFLASYAAEFRGYNIRITDYHIEYGFIVCAFLNAFILYPIYLLWVRRKGAKSFDPPPPPNNGMPSTPCHEVTHDSKT